MFDDLYSLINRIDVPVYNRQKTEVSEIHYDFSFFHTDRIVFIK